MFPHRADRLLVRPGHDTITDGDMGLYVLLNFLRLYDGHGAASHVRGVDVVRVPFLSLRGELASWGAQGDSATEMWQRVEVGAGRACDARPQHGAICRTPWEGGGPTRSPLSSVGVRHSSSFLELVDATSVDVLTGSRLPEWMGESQQRKSRTTY